MKKKSDRPFDFEPGELVALDLNAAVSPAIELTSIDFGNERDQVEAAALAGRPEDEIARMLGLDVETLRRRYSDALALTPARALEEVASAVRKTADRSKPSPLRAQARALLRKHEGQRK